MPVHRDVHPAAPGVSGPAAAHDLSYLLVDASRRVSATDPMTGTWLLSITTVRAASSLRYTSAWPPWLNRPFALVIVGCTTIVENVPAGTVTLSFRRPRMITSRPALQYPGTVS